MAQNTQVWDSNPANIKKAAQLLERDEVVAIPTETVYGLAGNAFSAAALAKIFEAKERPTFDPLIVHVSQPTGAEPSLEWLAALEIVSLDLIRTRFGENAVRAIDALIQKYWPGPMTLVLPKNSKIPDLATAGLDTVGVRMPSHPIAQEILRECGFPIAAPSANRFGRISPTSAEHVLDELSGRIAGIVDGGPCLIGVESTILGFDPTAREFILLRPGRITADDINAVTAEFGFGKMTQNERATSVASAASAPVAGAALIAPGQTESHYSPTKTMRFADEKLTPKTATGVLCLKASDKMLWQSRGYRRVEALSFSGDLAEIAQNLFAKMRELDRDQSVEMIEVEPLPLGQTQSGLGFAIMDRLKRATAPKHTQ